MSVDLEDQASLILAAEDCEPEQFEQLHRFSRSDEQLIAKLMAHGPVLLRGSRGSGKSALMIEASRRLAPAVQTSSAFGIYVSLRHLELLRTKETEYERFFSQLLLKEVRERLRDEDCMFYAQPTVTSVQHALSEVSSHLGKRIVLFFDDAAHIGRETSLDDFFDIFRTISSSTVSCKAAIYPGVTRFGNRFDVFNDATVLDVSRSEELPGFVRFFEEVMEVRYPVPLSRLSFRGSLSREDVAGLLGQAVLGNMRAFVFACNELNNRTSGSAIGLTELGDTLLSLAANHFWPLLEELKPKLGLYEPMIEPAIEIGEVLFEQCARAPNSPTSALVHRDITERLAKPFEILEYVGFITRREVSRAMKSRGRGARFALNLCNLLEKTPGTRLTQALFDQWSRHRADPVEFHRGSDLLKIEPPDVKENAEIEILNEPITKLRQSNAYPYGPTENKIKVLQEAGIHTVRDLASADDGTLLRLPWVGHRTLERFRNVVGQAIWM